MNGYKATQAIRKIDQAKQIPIIALTAGNVKNEREKCMEAGMSDFVTKPVIEETIALVIEKWFDITPNTFSAQTSAGSNLPTPFDINVLKNYFRK